MSDLIDRKAAIDALGEAPKYKQRIVKTYAEGRNDQWFDDVTKLSLLPSAQPERYWIDSGGKISALPSAQPERKRGKWLVDEDGNMECPFCGNTCGFGNYCNECGADMRGIDNG